MESFFVILHFLQDYGRRLAGRSRAQSRTPPAHAADRRGACLHPAFSIAVYQTRFDTAQRCAARFLNFPHLMAGSGHRHVPRAPLPSASRSACAEDRASKIFVGNVGGDQLGTLVYGAFKTVARWGMM